MKILYSLIACLFLLVPVANAQEEVLQTPAEQPDIPKSLESVVAGGAQIYYLGEYQGLYGWALIRQGRPEYFYQTKNGKAMVMGILFDEDGEMVTSGQLAQLHANEGDDMFAMTGGAETLVNPQAPLPTRSATAATTPTNTAPRAVIGNATSLYDKPLSRAEEMFVDVRSANWLTYGENGTHEIFAFIDPDCPHCQMFIESIKPMVDAGILKVRVLPVGIDPASERRAAMMLATGNPMERFLQYASGDASALNPPENINTAAVNQNKQVLLGYNFDVTPIIVYRSGGGEIRIVRGRPQDMDMIVRDIATQ